MKKKTLLGIFLSKRNHEKILLGMKLTIATILLATTQVFATDFSSQNKVTFKIQNAPLKKVFVEIEKKTIFRIVFNDDILPSNKKISIQAINEDIEKVLDRVLLNTNLIYKIPSQTVIVIAPKNEVVEAVFPVEKTITGKITNERGDPLEGASVTVKGATKGVLTDRNGVFKIQVNDTRDKILVMFYSGYVQKEISTDNSNITVALVPSIDNLQDVVVIGYGTVKRKDLTGSVSKVSMGDVQKAPVKSIGDALAGRVAGMRVSSSDGQPGSTPTIVIRGANSVTQDNSPLYVIGVSSLCPLLVYS